MGKNISYTYNCDNPKCNKTFKSSKDVMRLDDRIVDGEDQVIFAEGERDKYFCRDCFINRITLGKKIITDVCKEEIKEEINSAEVLDCVDKEYTTLLKINNEADELTFIQFLGHLSKENFNKLFKKSLVGSYYPVEGNTDIQVNFNNCYNADISVIHTMFAGIPQIKTVKEAYVDDVDGVAFILKSELEGDSNGPQKDQTTK